jgi:uncharacterized protein (TIGR02145 family)
MKLKKFIFKHRYLFLIILAIVIPAAILASLTYESYTLNKNNAIAIRTRQSDNSTLSSSAICTINTSNFNYFVPNKTFNEINSFLTHLPSGVAVGSGCCIDGICDGAAGENCNNCFADCGSCCSGSLTDTRDGKTYPMIRINTQCWMGKNLDYGTQINVSVAESDNGIAEKHCYNDSSASCTIFGALYTRTEAQGYVMSAGVQGICPTDWHLPSLAEWKVLTNYAGGDSAAGYKLKEAGNTHWAGNVVGIDSYGFTALPGGQLSVPDRSYVRRTTYAYFAVSSANVTETVPRLWNEGTSVFDGYGQGSGYGVSVRCIKNGNGVGYNLSYSAVNGTISGSSLQNIEGGASGQTVTVIPNSGYRFSNWSDGSTANPRTDINVQSNKTLTATCVPLFCGDNSCNGTETCASCSADCGKCPYCGDGYCNGYESCGNFNDPVQDSAHYSACYSDCSYCSCYSNSDCIAGGGSCSGFSNPTCNGTYFEPQDGNYYNCFGTFNSKASCESNGCSWDPGAAGLCV